MSLFTFLKKIIGVSSKVISTVPFITPKLIVPNVVESIAKIVEEPEVVTKPAVKQTKKKPTSKRTQKNLQTID